MEKKVQPPAIALLVVAGMTVLLFVISLFGNQWMMQAMEHAQMPEEQLQQFRDMMEKSSMVGNVVGGILNIGGAALIAFGAWRMKEMKSYGLAMTASILAMIPCFTSCCCLLGLPAGIWALIVLLDKDVKAAFDVPTTPPAL
ncbi:MAG: hypothetical protein NTY35_05030 [Planctomycetota bacterium]|nr:hypothetical protein [Planctomycetota bacterium]